MAVQIILSMIIILLIIVIAILKKTNKSKNNTLQYMAKENENLKESLNKLKSDSYSTLNQKNNDLERLQAKLDDIKKGEYTLLDLYSIDIDYLNKLFIIIERDRSVSLKSKKYLLKLLIFFLLSNQTSISLNDLNTNKKSLLDNVRTIRKYIVLKNIVESTEDMKNLGNAILSLIFYHREKRYNDK